MAHGKSVGLVVVERGKGCVTLSFANGHRSGKLTPREARIVAAELIRHAEDIGDPSSYTSGSLPPRVRTRRAGI